MQNKNIGVVGFGIVGSQVVRWFKLKNHHVFIYDKFKKIGQLKDLDNAQIIFLCLPTPLAKNQKTGVNLSVLKKIISLFKAPKIFIIKSTVPPGTTEELQKIFAGHYFFHNPEFLTETSAWKDFSRPILQIIGYTQKSKNLGKAILKILPRAQYSSILSATAAEIFKYSRNAFFATKVIFANQIYDLCKAFNIDYEDIKKLMSEEPWIGSNHLQIIHKGYRGFGGKCLPKDLKTFIKVYKSKKLKPEFFEIINEINNQLLKKQKLTKTLQKFWLNNKNG